MSHGGDEQKQPAARRGDEAESLGRKKSGRRDEAESSGRKKSGRRDEAESSGSGWRDEGESAELVQAKQRLASLRKSLDELLRQRETIEQQIVEEKDSIKEIEKNLLLKTDESSSVKFWRLLDMHINEVEALRAEKNLLPKPQEILSEIQDLESHIPGLSYIHNAIALGPPSSVERRGLFQVQNNNLYDCYFPARAQPPLPLTLACEVFGKFVDDFKNNDSLVDNKTCKCVVDLFYDVLGRMNNIQTENEFQWEFNSRLGEFLGLPVSPYGTRCKGVTFLTDATITNGEKWIFLGEYKLEKGSTLVQGLQSFVMYVASLKGKAELLPCFFLEVIGPTARIGALAYLKKVTWQPLTPFMNCFYTDHDRTDMFTFCKALCALKMGLNALRRYYDEAHSVTCRDIPYPLLGRKNCYRIGNRLVFIVTHEDGQQRIVKYCRRYGKEVHTLWAQAGLAPELYSCKKLAGGWLEAEMQYLKDWTPCFSLLNDRIASGEVTEAISRALEKGLSITIEGCAVAHGDMRSPNIFVKEAIGGGYDIKFIDFDWAGKVSEATYPPFLNENVKWPPGVEAGKFLRQEHDRWWLTKLKDHDVTASRSSYLRG